MKRLAFICITGFFLIFYLTACVALPPDAETFSPASTTAKQITIQDLFSKDFYFTTKASDSSEEISEDSLQQVMQENISVSIIDVQENDGETSKATAKIIMPDIMLLFENLVQFSDENISEDELQQLVTEHLPQYLCEKIITVEVKRRNKEWVLFSDTQVNELIAEEIDKFIIAAFVEHKMDDITIDLDMEAFSK